MNLCEKSWLVTMGIGFSLTAIISYGSTDPSQTAMVSGFAESFLTTARISDGIVTVLETGETYRTDQTGKYGPIHYPVGQPITLEFSKQGYHTTQSATLVVPAEGFVGRLREITFQVPSNFAFWLFSTAIGADIDDNHCHVVTTVTAPGKTLADIPQGEPGAELTLAPTINEKPFYFDIFTIKPLFGKTNPFSRHLNLTSEDGGAAFVNVPIAAKPYVLSARKPGVTFSKTYFLCRKGVFINISPPQGPSVLRP